MKVKVCGITSIEQMKAIDELGVNYAGMIFYPASKRYVRPHINPFALAKETFALKKVGVFVNATLEEIKQAIEEYALDLVQLHGDETPEFCNDVEKHIPVIKAVPVADEANALSHISYNTTYILFDTASKAYGGSGKKFNWQMLEQLQHDRPYFLSGGIALGDAATITSLNEELNNKIFAVDLNSGFEISPGVKDINLVKTFLAELKHHNP